MKNIEDIVRRLWSPDASAYYKELERFLKAHADAHNIVYHTESGVPIKVEYYFVPWTVYVDKLSLEQKLREIVIPQEPHE